MKAPLFIRSLTEDERNRVQAGLRSSEAFELRRCPILLSSARSERAPVIAKHLGGHKQTILTVIHGFNTSGLVVVLDVYSHFIVGVGDGSPSRGESGESCAESA
ncbi:MAG TPA: helix-turn-helix domain-containing protein [Ktedonobacteraceae bacterium]